MDAIVRKTLTEVLGFGPAELVAFVGAGGKTTAVLLLGGELAARGRDVVTTTTTAMFCDQLAAAGPILYWTDDDALATLESTLAAGGRAAVAYADGEEGKVVGLPAADVDDLWASGVADYLLVEADGSRGLPFKAFAPYEPQVPSATTTVVDVAGLDVIGAPLTEEHVHRAGLLAAELGIPAGTAVTPQVMSAGLTAQARRLRTTHPACRLVVLLNKAESAEAAAAAREVSRGLLLPHDDAVPAADAVRPDRVVIGSLSDRWFTADLAA